MPVRKFALLPFLLLAGCHPIYGLDSRTVLPHQVNLECVKEAFLTIPEADNTGYSRREYKSIEILPKQRNVLIVSHTWSYGGHGGVQLRIDDTPDGWDYRNGIVSRRYPISNEETAGLSLLIENMNRTIESRCGFPVAELPVKSWGR